MDNELSTAVAAIVMTGRLAEQMTPHELDFAISELEGLVDEGADLEHDDMTTRIQKAAESALLALRAARARRIN